MNRYKSSQRWKKVEAGWYLSPGHRFTAWQPDTGRPWNLYANRPHYQWELIASHVTLADCQEHADNLTRAEQLTKENQCEPS